MAIFFLLVGLEVERELYIGELASFKKAVLPIAAAVGGMLVPAIVHYIFNKGTIINDFKNCCQIEYLMKSIYTSIEINYSASFSILRFYRSKTKVPSFFYHAHKYHF